MASTKKVDATELMVVNDAPGDECRIAILENNHLEELYSERTATATNVGNIYKGRVVNVEPAIQAAFIDYGEGVNGFLHISDLHPRYFPGEERTERVGKKIPRRDRPPIQHALKRGQEILVQVLKEGIGTKGPTLTSYLSIPGRLLVLMPEMDRVGVSRKVEDEETRREMRKLLDGLDLPEGFGFILRTAGIGRSKTELKRDVAYLSRLWKVMEKRIKNVGAPCELYTESDLLIRTVRDVLRPTISAIVVDSQSAHDRLSQFLQVVAPRSSPPVIRYARKAPIFHAFDIERQIELIHSRQVPLASGGQLIIEQTEALVAIDVNSGKSRGARDSETNAYQTNCEAVDEICRQLRLRDLGGLIINDLIDMHQSRHRRQIEERFHENLKRDRARTTVLRISEFGLIEMTRQRMRPSLRKSHFMTCPQCDGHGEIKAPESVAADVTRQIGFLLDQERVRRLELVCSPRVASVLLSRKRRELVHLEEGSGKQINVRVSDDIAVDRVDYYAYDERGADLAIDQIPALNVPDVLDLLRDDSKREKLNGEADGETSGRPAKRKRSRRRRSGPADATAVALAAPPEEEWAHDEVGEGDDDAERPDRKRSRRRRRRKKTVDSDQPSTQASAPAADEDDAAKRKPSRRSRRGGKKADEATPTAEGESIRIHQLAKELEVPSRVVIERCESDAQINVKNHMSSVSAGEAAIIAGWFSDGEAEDKTEDSGPGNEQADASGDSGDKPKRRRRRRGGRGRGGRGRGQKQAAAVEAEEEKSASNGKPAGSADAKSAVNTNKVDQSEPKSKKKSRRRGSKKKSGSTSAGSSGATTNGQSTKEQRPASPQTESSKPEPLKKRRTLYRNRKGVSPAAREAAVETAD